MNLSSGDLSHRTVWLLCLALASSLVLAGCRVGGDGNKIPVADAGDDARVMIGSAVNLDGSGSYDADGEALTFAWELTQRPAQSLAVLDDASLAAPAFTADAEGDYVLTLYVSDGHAQSEPDQVSITTGVDWSLEDHAAEDLSYQDLSYGIFEGADLAGSDITGTSFYLADLDGADLSGAYFSNFTLDDPLACLDPPKHLFTGADLTNANLSGFTTADPGAGPSGWRTCDGTMEWMSFSFREATLAGAVFDGANLDTVDFAGADLTGASMNLVIMERCNFAGADLSGATVLRNNTGAYPPGSFVGATMVGTSLTGDFWQSSFAGADLTDATVTMPYLGGEAYFTGATLVRTNLTVNYGEADFTDADLTDATVSLTSTTITWSNTTCPDGTNSDDNSGTCAGHL